jgi:lipoyl(octanoyl) transferase
LNEDELKTKKAVFYKINRGGDITYHGPGQLVVYPILDLEQFFTDIHKYMRLLEQAVIQTIAVYGLKGERIEGMTGVWLDAGSSNERKICALGVKASRWVTMHGIGFNVNTDLDYFSNIVPCGIEDKAVTSMEKELGRTLELSEVQAILLQELKDLFEFRVM